MSIDILGAITSLLATYLFICVDKKAWYITMLASVINGWLYWQKGIYADTALECVYFLSACYGLYAWTPHREKNSADIKPISLKQCFISLAILVALFFSITISLTVFTDSNIVLLDALSTSLSLVAQMLMCYKILLTWVLWFIADAIYVYMYFQKEIPFHSIMMLSYLMMAIIGYVQWSKQTRFEPKPNIAQNSVF